MTVPAKLAEIRDDFRALDKQNQLQLLLEFSGELPEGPERLQGDIDAMERVEECQSPVYILTELDDDETVSVFATAPAEAPTTRGFASILVNGLSGERAETVLAVPGDFAQSLGITETVSPLRIRGMTGMLGRIQRQVREHLSARS